MTTGKAIALTEWTFVGKVMSLPLNMLSRLVITFLPRSNPGGSDGKAKSKGEKERYKHLNAEFQRIARRDKKAFLSDQCREIKENNRMGRSRDLFKKIRDTKGTFRAKMGSIKDRSGLDLTEAEDIRKRWQEYTEELYKKRAS